MLSSLSKIVIFIQILNYAQAFTISKNHQAVIDQYLKLQNNFSKKFCSKGQDQKFDKYLKQYRGAGYFIPEINNEIDYQAIAKHIDLFEAKQIWIEKQLRDLASAKSLISFKNSSRKFHEISKALFKYKKEYDYSTDDVIREQNRDESRKYMYQLKKWFNEFLGNYRFFLNFKFPVDHLKNRWEYDLLKNSSNTKEQQQANAIFFKRKILEDGAYDQNHTYPDLYFRTTLDTVALKFQDSHDFLPDLLRYDLEWIISQAEKHLKRGYKKQMERLNEWLKRTSESKNFYKKLLANKEQPSPEISKILAEKHMGYKNLKNYVLEQEAAVYRHWIDQPELYRYLFVAETILFNEVGDVDGPGSPERRDVMRIVLNRSRHPLYNQLKKDQNLLTYLNDVLEKKRSNRPWLNLLFREGEFSFTYFYIPSSVRIFCPDMSSAGQKLRRENISVALETYQEQSKEFPALRYFSRASMLGRIDISSVWSNYSAYPERPGLPVKNPKKIIKALKSNDFDYLYSFIDDQQTLFRVIRIKNEFYSIQELPDTFKVHHYRNPHYFTYFISRDTPQS